MAHFRQRRASWRGPKTHLMNLCQLYRSSPWRTSSESTHCTKLPFAALLAKHHGQLPVFHQEAPHAQPQRHLPVSLPEAPMLSLKYCLLLPWKLYQHQLQENVCMSTSKCPCAPYSSKSAEKYTRQTHCYYLIKRPPNQHLADDITDLPCKAGTRLKRIFRWQPALSIIQKPTNLPNFNPHRLFTSLRPMNFHSLWNCHPQKHIPEPFWTVFNPVLFKTIWTQTINYVLPLPYCQVFLYPAYIYCKYVNCNVYAKLPYTTIR